MKHNDECMNGKIENWIAEKGSKLKLQKMSLKLHVTVLQVGANTRLHIAEFFREPSWKYHNFCKD